MQTEEFLSIPQTCWWNLFGSQPLTTESLAVKSSVSSTGANLETGQALDKQSLFTLSNGGVKSSGDVFKQNVAFTLQSACVEFGCPQPTNYTKHPHVEQYYGVVSAYGTQLPPGRVMIPLKMETEEDCTIYVNSKQYNGIIRRRQSRAKAVLKNKQSKCRKQPYMHHSRHLHAMRRPRGSGGRFLNTKKADTAKLSKPSNSQNSEVLHPENGTMDSSREANMLNFSGSEVTSMDYFLGSSVHSLGSMDMPKQWIAAATDISCCNLNS